MRLPLVSSVLDRDAVRRRVGTSIGLVQALAHGATTALPVALKEAPQLAASIATTAIGAGAAVVQQGRSKLPFHGGGSAEPNVPPLGRGQGTVVEDQRDRLAPPAAPKPKPTPAKAAAPQPAAPQPAAPQPPAAQPVATPSEPPSATTAEVKEAVQEALAEVTPDVVPGEQLTHAALPLPDYDHLTLPALRARIRKLDLTTLVQLREYEAAHGHRLPVLTSIDNRIAKLREEPADPA